MPSRAPAPSLTHTESHPPTQSSPAHTRTVTPAYAFSLVDADTQDTHVRTHTFFPVAVAVHTVRLQLVLTPLRFLVAGFSANIIPLVWMGRNRTVPVFVCSSVCVCVHVCLCRGVWAMLVVIV